MVSGISGIQAIGGLNSINVDIYREKYQQSYLYKKEMAIFKEDIKNCPSIFHGNNVNLTEPAPDNEKELLQSSSCDEIQNDLSFDKSKKGIVDNDVDDLFTQMMNSLEQNESTNNQIDSEFKLDNEKELPKFFNSQKLGPPFGLVIENFDYWSLT